MAILDQLDRLCAQFPDCNAVAYTDLTTGMVLAASTRVRLPQEQLDQLCLTAADLLNGAMAARFTSDMVQTAILIDGDTVELFLRVVAQPDEALCCDCTARVDIAAFARAAGAVLAAIVIGP